MITFQSFVNGIKVCYRNVASKIYSEFIYYNLVMLKATKSVFLCILLNENQCFCQSARSWESCVAIGDGPQKNKKG